LTMSKAALVQVITKLARKVSKQTAESSRSGPPGPKSLPTQIAQAQRRDRGAVSAHDGEGATQTRPLAHTQPRAASPRSPPSHRPPRALEADVPRRAVDDEPRDDRGGHDKVVADRAGARAQAEWHAEAAAEGACAWKEGRDRFGAAHAREVGRGERREDGGRACRPIVARLFESETRCDSRAGHAGDSHARAPESRALKSRACQRRAASPGAHARARAPPLQPRRTEEGAEERDAGKGVARADRADLRREGDADGSRRRGCTVWS
jgi:hypothetical protein